MELKIVDVMRDGGLLQVAEELENQQMHSIRLKAEVMPEAKLELGVSKLGGLPDLPKGAEWSKWQDEPLSFIAQLRTFDITTYDVENALPQSGMLYFFYDAENQPWGYSPDDRGGWKVLYYDGDSLLDRTSAPLMLPEHCKFKACGFHFSSEVNVPDDESLYIEELGLTEEEQNLLRDLLLSSEVFQEDDEITHRLLGHPDQIQGEMQLGCQLVFHGLYCGDSTGYQAPRAAELKAGAMDWQLLLQVDSEEAKMMWGDVGRLYYWIRREDLKACNFDNVWLELQCC